ncbi:MAG: cyoE 1 [Planctomycetaceae bacterium]|nr:cyoE 1 [Planctomycetaceae bacterium]
MKAENTLPYKPAMALTRAGDYFLLVRPRLALLVLVTVGAGWVLATGAEPSLDPLVHTLIGTGLLFAGASALNQLLERRSDALMARTVDRPLPSGRLRPWEVLVLGCTLNVVGLAYLLAAQQVLAAELGVFALVSYVLIYTPLKSKTTLNTLIGAIPGAVPPLMGWAAARGQLDLGALVLFLVVFLWQVPHFLAIAWIYRDQYARAGSRMLPVFDLNGVQTGRQMIRFTLVLILVSLLPFVLSMGSGISALGALVLGVGFLGAVLKFARMPTIPRARVVFRASLFYLPALLLIFVLDASLYKGVSP